ncbi:phosphate ABC transporter permease subunit PstC [Planctomycetes bacterium K23_9]|uniref:Phosphate transport system permease protein n=1 Tax=Stieleria marina TaxID=1930275 RepID=A0A517NVI7_9BACT|nr:Phosphate transport system permease protein PstC [Planctomycetes bacterium K23_9]
MTKWSLSTLSRLKSDWLFTVVTRSSACVAAAIVFLVVAFLISESIPAIRQIGVGRFITDASWHPLSDQFNLTPMIVASLTITLGAILIAAPLGISAAIYCQFYAPTAIAVWYRRLIELLSGIPSVVFGLWGLVVLAPIVARLGGSGQSILTASLVLGLMILPTVALTTQAALRSVPGEWLAGGAALGFCRSSTIRRIALPAARRGILGGLLLALARAMGETMAVLMLAGNVVEMPDSIVAPARTLTANIALEMGYATAGHRSVLFVSGLFLIAIVAVSVSLAGFGGAVDE